MSRGLGALFGSSLYSGAPLKQLVDRYATDALIQAVAREASTGRLLLVATTDVSTGEPVIWDLGSIAMNGGAGARALFRDVLVASASVPGCFPRSSSACRNNRRFTKRFTLTARLPCRFSFRWLSSSRPETQAIRRGAAVYVIVDGRLSEQPAPIRLRTRSILSRSVSAGLNHMLRTTLELTATDAELEGAQFQFAAIPVAYPQLDSFDFRTPTMRSLFQFGYQCAQAGRLWTSSRSVGQRRQTAMSTGAGQPNKCPADDRSIGRFAVR